MSPYNNNEPKKLRKRVIWFYRLMLLAVLIIFVQYARLMILKSTDLQKMNTANSVYNVSVQLPRGRIVDRNGVELAVSMVTGSLYVDPGMMFDKEEYKTEHPREVKEVASQLLAPVLQMDEEKLYEKFTQEGSRFAWIKRKLEPKDEAAVRKIIEDNHLPGLGFKMESKRYYTKKKAAAQILGFVGIDDNDEEQGRSGIEYLLDKELKSRKIMQQRSYDGKDRRIYDKHVLEPVDYKVSEVQLTIDSHMQYVLEQAIDDAISKYQANGAAAIIMDPYTGEILSMVSRPTFDPNSYGDYAPETWSNKGVTMMYEPGSVFKPIVGCIGMTKGVVEPETTFYDAGNIRIADRVFHNWDGTGAGVITFTDVIKNSVNTGMIELGRRIGKQDMVEGAKMFGFGSYTNVDLPGEAEGLLYTKDMYDPDLASFSIGQGIAVTPLQELRAICAIANGGELLKPYIVKKVTDPDGNVIREGHKEVVRNVITEDTARKMRQMMEKVVSEGGGNKAAIKGYRIAGKTGTAEKKAANGGYAAGQYIASFVGFVPADKPKYAMLVLIDTPKGNRFYGSQVAAPIFRDVLQQILVLKGIEPSDYSNLITLNDTMNNANHRITPMPELRRTADGKLILPKCNGLDVRQTMELFGNADLRLRPYGSGYAFIQKPESGTVVEPGTVVEVWYH